MHRTYGLEALQRELLKAVGPSRSLDGLIVRTLGKHHPASDDPEDLDCWELGNDLVDAANPYPETPYTDSIDADLRLIRQLLAGWTLAHLDEQDDGAWFCELREGFSTSYDRVAMSGTLAPDRPKTAALALLVAMVAALRANSASH